MVKNGLPIPDVNLKIVCCPCCHGQLRENEKSLTCLSCQRDYPQIEDYFDFFLDDEILSSTEYPRGLQSLKYTREKILSLPEPRSQPCLDVLFHRRAYVSERKRMLSALKESVRKYGASERSRVEFMVDNPLAEEFMGQRAYTEIKARLLMNWISQFAQDGGNVLHVGCGGICNEAIPIAYRNAGYINFGVDAVRSYVNEFRSHGEAHLANASALPFADETFSVVNFTDILEHLFDPLRGLREASRVLKKGGYLMLETPNRNYVSRKNPFTWVEYFLGRLSPHLLRPRIITGCWEGEVMFHTEFGLPEIKSLLKHSGLVPQAIRTEVIRQARPPDYAGMIKEMLVAVFETFIPVNKWMIVAKRVE